MNPERDQSVSALEQTLPGQPDRTVAPEPETARLPSGSGPAETAPSTGAPERSTPLAVRVADLRLSEIQREQLAQLLAQANPDDVRRALTAGVVPQQTPTTVYQGQGRARDRRAASELTPAISTSEGWAGYPLKALAAHTGVGYELLRKLKRKKLIRTAQVDGKLVANLEDVRAYQRTQPAAGGRPKSALEPSGDDMQPAAAVARAIGLSVDRLYDLAAEGRLRSERRGPSVYVSLAEASYYVRTKASLPRQ